MALNLTWSGQGRYKMCHTGQNIGISTSGAFHTQALITLTPTYSVGGIPSNTLPNTYAGTTNTSNLSGSWARLAPDPIDFPIGSKVVYAAAMWNADTTSTTAQVDANPVYFKDPLGQIFTITIGDSAFYYNGPSTKSRGIDATTIVKTAGNGNYSMSNFLIPNNTDNLGSGWTIFIVYEHPSFAYKSINFYSGYWDFTSGVSISGLITPTSGTYNSRFFITSVNGNGDYAGELVYFNGFLISGPNNPSNNFFAGQVNDSRGLLTTVGSFGNLYAPPGSTIINKKACFDITNVDVSNAVKGNINTVNITYIPGAEWMYTNALALETSMNAANLELTKNASSIIVSPNDSVIYTLSIYNNGAATATSLFFVDTLADNLLFNSNSVSVNGISQPTFNPQTGFSLPNLVPFGRITITFSVTVSALASINSTIPNTFYVGYKFTPAANTTTISDGVVSNEVDLTVFQDDLSLTKFVDKTFALINDTITYSIVITTSNFNAYKTYFVDTLSTGSSYIANTLTLNTINLNISSLSNPILISTLPSNTVNTITFMVKNSLTSGTIPNWSNLIYNYSIANTTVPRSLVSNIVTTTIATPNILFTKNVDKTVSTLNSQLLYTLVVTNNGNVSFSNLFLKDTIPNGTTFINNSLTINNLPDSNNIQNGVFLPSLSPNEICTVTFRVLIN